MAEAVVYEGPLGVQKRRHVEDRYGVLYLDCLRYYSSREDYLASPDLARGCVVLEEVTGFDVLDGKFRLHIGQKELTLRAQDLQQWTDALESLEVANLAQTPSKPSSIRSKSPAARADLRSLAVEIVGARLPRRAGIDVDLGLYAVCEIAGKPRTRFQTEAVVNSLSPEWLHKSQVVGCAPGDSLTLQVYMKDHPTSSGFVGKAELLYLQFKGGFDGEVVLSSPGRVQNGYLRVRVAAEDAAGAPPNAKGAPHAGTAAKEPILCQGMLKYFRKTEASGKAFESYFVLTKTAFRFHASAEDFRRGGAHQGRVEVHDIDRIEILERGFKIFLMNPDRYMHLHLNASEALEAWIKAFRELLSKSLGAEFADLRQSKSFSAGDHLQAALPAAAEAATASASSTSPAPAAAVVARGSRLGAPEASSAKRAPAAATGAAVAAAARAAQQAASGGTAAGAAGEAPIAQGATMEGMVKKSTGGASEPCFLVCFQDHLEMYDNRIHAVQGLSCRGHILPAHITEVRMTNDGFQLSLDSRGVIKFFVDSSSDLQGWGRELKRLVAAESASRPGSPRRPRSASPGRPSAQRAPTSPSSSSRAATPPRTSRSRQRAPRTSSAPSPTISPRLQRLARSKSPARGEEPKELVEEPLALACSRAMLIESRSGKTFHIRTPGSAWNGDVSGKIGQSETKSPTPVRQECAPPSGEKICGPGLLGRAELCVQYRETGSTKRENLTDKVNSRQRGSLLGTYHTTGSIQPRKSCSAKVNEADRCVPLARRPLSVKVGCPGE